MKETILTKTYRSAV